MSLPSSPVLQRLHCLDRSSSDFQDKLSNILYGRDYVQCVRNLQGDDLMWLVAYLDKVHCHVPFPTLCSGQRRLLIISTLPATLPGSVEANSEAYVAIG